MPKVGTNHEVDAFAGMRENPPNKELVKALRKRVLETSPMEEAVNRGFPHYSQIGGVRAAIPYRNHVNIEFYRGTELHLNTFL